jgi:hypothetical protein
MDSQDPVLIGKCMVQQLCRAVEDNPTVQTSASLEVREAKKNARMSSQILLAQGEKTW